MKRIFIVLAALLLCGCGFFGGLQPPVEPALMPAMPANVRAVCEAISDAPITNMGQLLEAHSALVGQYGECAALNHSKVEWYALIKSLLEKKP